MQAIPHTVDSLFQSPFLAQPNQLCARSRFLSANISFHNREQGEFGTLMYYPDKQLRLEALHTDLESRLISLM